MKLADPADPAQGIVFDGRVAEDFKLSTGTWVHVGALRVKLIAAGDPLIQDAVITGHDRDEVGALVFLSPARQGHVADAISAAPVADPREACAGRAAARRASPRLLVMTEPPSIDANEITDKGYMNQRAVLERRAALVEKLYSASADVISLDILAQPGNRADGDEGADDLQRASACGRGTPRPARAARSARS